MNLPQRALRLMCLLAVVLAFSAALAAGAPPRPYEPEVGQPGRDVVWVPTPPALIEKMLDMAKVTPNDYVIDLGSGDGRNVIAAAKRGALALGVEYNLDLVELSQRRAKEEGVEDRARFVQGDMYEADISGASVLALFLLTENLDQLVPHFLGMRPGARIVINGFGITGWVPDETGQAHGDCGDWCIAHLFIVPARVDGTWRLQGKALTLRQSFQTFTGTLESDGLLMPVTNGRLRGDRITFTADGRSYSGRVSGGQMEGTIIGDGRSWRAVRRP